MENGFERNTRGQRTSRAAAAVPQVNADLALGMPGSGEKCLNSWMCPPPLSLAQRSCQCNLHPASILPPSQKTSSSFSTPQIPKDSLSHLGKSQNQSSPLFKRIRASGGGGSRLGCRKVAGGKSLTRWYFWSQHPLIQLPTPTRPKHKGRWGGKQVSFWCSFLFPHLRLIQGLFFRFLPSHH